MPPTSTHTQQETTEEFEPEQDEMFERKGFDRRGIRRELAAVTPIALDDLEIERDEKEFVDPRTLSMDFGPTGMGETDGTGIETVRMDGESWRTIRYANGFEYNAEEGVNDTELQRRAVSETFDFLADANFMKGVYDYGRDQKLRPGIFDWLKGAIPDERVLDARDYDGSNDAIADYSNTPESLVKYEAFSTISGDLLTRDDPNWDLAIGRQQALARLNKPTTTDTGRTTYRQLINSGEAKGGVNDDILIPPELELDTIPAGAGIEEEPPSIDLTDELAEDELILIPDAQVMRNRWARLSEMPNPEVFGPQELRMGRRAVDYAWRYSHKFDPDNYFPNAKDAVRLTNIDALMD